MEIFERIKLLREAKGLSQADIAANLEIASQNYWKIEKGKTELTVSRLEQIARILGVSVIELLTGEAQKVEDIEEVERLKRRVEELEKDKMYYSKTIDFLEEKATMDEETFSKIDNAIKILRAEIKLVVGDLSIVQNVPVKKRLLELEAILLLRIMRRKIKIALDLDKE